MSDQPQNDTPQDDKQPAQPDTTPGNDSGQSGNEPTFTQADLDRIAAKTRQEAAERARKTLFEELGIDDADALKQTLEEARKRKEAEMTEAQKLEAKLLKEQERAKELQAQIDQMHTAQKQAARESTFKDAMRSAGAASDKVNRLFILVKSERPDEFAALFDDDNSVLESKLTAFTKDVQADYGEYFATSGAGSPSNAGGTPPTPSTQNEQAVRQHLRKRLGKL